MISTWSMGHGIIRVLANRFNEGLGNDPDRLLTAEWPSRKYLADSYTANVIHWDTKSFKFGVKSEDNQMEFFSQQSIVLETWIPGTSSRENSNHFITFTVLKKHCDELRELEAKFLDKSAVSRYSAEQQQMI